MRQGVNSSSVALRASLLDCSMERFLIIDMVDQALDIFGVACCPVQLERGMSQ